jgi:hypothetical protein
VKPQGVVVRTPQEVVPLIRRELEQGTEHYQAAGRLLLEAKAGLPHGAFKPWIREQFAISYKQASRYMRLAAKGDMRVTFRDLEADPTTRRQVQQRKKARTPAETAQMREMAHLLITTGFRTLAARFHPDHPGGSVDAMARLNRVREGLMRQVISWLGSGRVIDEKGR